ncbi:MAG TPA: response regulator [Patescibacteria group bacterium]|nr:response regulator [Patescibacteria group bacterium]
MAYDFSDVKVLVVETSPPLFDLVKGVLTFFTVPESSIHSAFGVEEAYAKFAAENHDLLIVDWLENPDRGLTLTKRLRSDSTCPNPFVPILMTAGSGHQNRVIKARDAGVSDYLVKPFTARALALKIENIVEHPRSFVLAETYTGPDRRRKNVKIDFPDRRAELINPAMPVAFRKDIDGKGKK